MKSKDVREKQITSCYVEAILHRSEWEMDMSDFMFENALCEGRFVTSEILVVCFCGDPINDKSQIHFLLVT